MKFLRSILALFIIILFPNISLSAQRNTYDIIIAGAGTGGISAAIQAARMGRSVLVVEQSSQIGGQAIAAGVSTMDDKSGIQSGIYADFIARIKKYYDSRGKSMGTCYWSSNSIAFEPHIGLEALINMINEARRKGTLDFLMSSEIIEIREKKRVISGVTVRLPDNAKRMYTCKVLIDATEYGDILPIAKAAYRVGNSDSRFVNNNSLVQDITWTAVIRKYNGGVPENLKPKTPLPGYELAKRNYDSYVTPNGKNFANVYPVELPVNFMTQNAYRGLPDSTNPYNYDAGNASRAYITKTSLNWGNDYPGAYLWEGKKGLPAAYLEDRNVRKQIEHDALMKTLHFIYYIQNELGEPWSVADDEYRNRVLPEAAKGLPYEWQEIVRRMPVIPYVRESRRIIAKHTLTSHELLQNSLSYRDGETSHEFSDAIAIGGYILDLHGANSDGDAELEFNERSNSAEVNRPRGAFQVPMDIMIPEKTDGLIAAEKNLSMSRFAAGALRLQPITMMTGQAAGVLAAISANENILPRNIHALRVQWELLNSGVVLSLCNYSDVPNEHPLNRSIQISNLYSLIDPQEYPHAPSHRMDFLDDPVIAMAIIRGANKGVFGVDEIITREKANTILMRARNAFAAKDDSAIIDDELHNFISRGDFARAVCVAFPILEKIERPKNSRIPFRLAKHRNSEYVATLAQLGILNIYNNDSEFHYGRPVTKGEAADIIVRAAVKALGA